MDAAGRCPSIAGPHPALLDQGSRPRGGPPFQPEDAPGGRPPGDEQLGVRIGRRPTDRLEAVARPARGRCRRRRGSRPRRRRRSGRRRAAHRCRPRGASAGAGRRPRTRRPRRASAAARCRRPGPARPRVPSSARAIATTSAEYRLFARARRSAGRGDRDELGAVRGAWPAGSRRNRGRRGRPGDRHGPAPGAGSRTVYRRAARRRSGHRPRRPPRTRPGDARRRSPVRPRPSARWDRRTSPAPGAGFGRRPGACPRV